MGAEEEMLRDGGEDQVINVEEESTKRGTLQEGDRDLVGCEEDWFRMSRKTMEITRSMDQRRWRDNHLQQ